MSLLKRRSRSETRIEANKTITGNTNTNATKTKTAMENVTTNNEQHTIQRVHVSQQHPHKHGEPYEQQQQQLLNQKHWHKLMQQQDLELPKNSLIANTSMSNIISGHMGRRKTSAELISEAKSYLGEMQFVSMAGVCPQQHRLHAAGVGGVRLVSTRRPVTPREPGRVLYGKVALAGRPPSAFSMLYLQTECSSRAAPKTPPALEPLKIPNINNIAANEPTLVRSVHSTVGNSMSNNLNTRKLPALQHKSLSLTKALEADANTTTVVMHTDNVREMLLPRAGGLLKQSNSETLIEMLKQHAGLKDCNAETVQHINAILLELYTRVRKHEKKHKRGFILGGLYGLVECNSPQILLAVARVVLALRVTGSNLTGACKLIFKVARQEQNDHLFHDNDLLELLIDGLGHASPLDDPEACIYGYGSIRFLTTSNVQERHAANNEGIDLNRNLSDCLNIVLAHKPPATAPPLGNGTHIKKHANILAEEQARYNKLCKQYTLVERLARHGAVELMILHLQILNEACASRRLTGPPLHSLYQLSATIRALADVRCQTQPTSIKVSATNSIQLELACPHLIRAAEVAMDVLEVQVNIVRTLSVLSEDTACCQVLVNYTARIAMLLAPCADYNANSQNSEKHLAVLSRLGYILGNILAKFDNGRVQYYHNDVAMEYLLNILDAYSKAPLTLRNAQGDTIIDVLIKLIRVIANMSVNPEVGFGLGNTRTLGAVLLNLLNAHVTTTAKTSSKKMKSELQELLHATLSALHNLCFYQDKISTPTQVIESKGSLQSILSDLATGLCAALRSCQLEATKVEIARVLGNLTRNENARRNFCDAGGLALIVQHLTRNPTQDYDLKACAIGVLVNLLGDYENRAPFLQIKGAEVLALLLRGALEQEDWFLATIVCQAIWNLLIDEQCANELCQDCVLDEISDLLADYLDEERLFEGNNFGNGNSNGQQQEQQRDTHDMLWEDFALVATDLLERIQNNYDKDALNDALDNAVAHEQVGDEQNDNSQASVVTTTAVADVNNKTMLQDNDDEDVFIDEM